MGILQFLIDNLQIIQAITPIIAIFVVVFSWFFISHKNRKLQRKKIAIELLSHHRFEKQWTDSLSIILKTIRTKSNYNWEEIAISSHDKSNAQSKQQQDMHEAIRCVLNYFEFVSIAVLNNAVDEDIIRWSYGFFYTHIYKELKPYILKSRNILNEDSLHINFEKLALNWGPKESHATPT